MTNIYNQALLKAPKRNKFDMSTLHDTTVDVGYINVVDVKELLPGDTFVGNIAHKIRTFPMKSPAFQSYDVGWFAFFCPNRLLMVHDKWQKFIAEDENATPPPYVQYDFFAKYSHHFDDSVWGIEPQSLANYMGMPIFSDDPDNPPTDDTPISLMPFLAYQKIYDEWFRDENLIASDWDAYMELFGEGGKISALDPDDYKYFDSLTELKHRAFKKDRFTSATTTTQKGANVVIPLGPGSTQRIPVENINPQFYFSGQTPSSTTGENLSLIFGLEAQGDVTLNSSRSFLNSAYRDNGIPTPTPYSSVLTSEGNPKVQIQLGDGTGVYVDLETIPGISVNAWRTAVMTQSFLERLETCGSRYTEVIRGMFGVFTPDARLQRPELIKAWRSSILIGDVLQQEETSEMSTPAGTLRGVGMGIGSGASYKYRAYEHGYLIVLMSILPRQSYFQGLPRLFTKSDRYDYFWPLLAHQGEEAILNRELYFQPGSDQNTGTFGYQSRYYDYRSSYNRISGLLAGGESLDYWQGSRYFENLPTLSSQFIECRWQDSDQDRLFPVDFYPSQSYGYFICSFYVNYKAWRPCPRFATPAII